jgi:hypothetical protein
MNRYLTFLSLLLAALVTASVAAQNPAPRPPDPPGTVFAGLVGGANPAAQTLTVTVPGKPGSTLQVTSVQPSWLTVTVANQGSEAQVTLSVDLKGPAADLRRATVELKSSDATAAIKKIIVLLATLTPRADDAAYLVEFRYTGYTGLVEGYPNCQVNPLGFDVLKGVVTGREAVARGDDVEYHGTLGRMTSIDFCETRGKTRAGDDERVWCAAKLTGIASMKVQLDVYGEIGRGAWLKADPDGSWFTGSVKGTCESADMREWEQDYPGGDSGGSPSGQPIDESAVVGGPRLVAPNGRTGLVVGTFPSRNPKGGWEMKVLAKLR